MDYNKLSKIVDAEEQESQITEEEVAAKIEASLPKLAAYVKEHFGIETKFYGEEHRGYFPIESDNLLDTYADSVVDRLMFKDIRISSFSSSSLYEVVKNGYLWTNLHFSYEHVSGGSNGTEIPEGTIFYVVAADDWMGREEASKYFKD